MKKHDWKTGIGICLLCSALSVAAAPDSRNCNVYGDMSMKRKTDAGKERLRIQLSGKKRRFSDFLPAETVGERHFQPDYGLYER